MAGPGSAVPLARGALGVACLALPDQVAGVLGRPHPTESERVLVRALGLRQLVQAVLERRAGGFGLRLGVAVDVVHAGTALLYARTDRGGPPGRRDAATATSFALAGLLRARHA